MTSILLTGYAALQQQLIDKLVTAGYPYDKLTVSFDKYLGSVLSGLVGGTNPYLTKSRATMLSEIDVALGGSSNPLTEKQLQTMADIIDSSPGGLSYLILEDASGNFLLEDSSGKISLEL